jgi:spore coat polysaccharide biosynthesis protein SpsF
MKGERVVAVVEARMTSSRLPGKSMKPLAGAPLIQRVLERLVRAKTVDRVVLATSTAPTDDVLAEHAKTNGFALHRGSETDVLGRILGAAREHEATIHVQMWGDCPCLEPAEVDRVVEYLVANDLELAGNELDAATRLVPIGLDVLAFRVSALEAADRETQGNAYHREHGSTYIYETPGRFRLGRCVGAEDLWHPRLDLTVNYAKDYEFQQEIYRTLFPKNPTFEIRDLLAHIRETETLRTHPNAIFGVAP